MELDVILKLFDAVGKYYKVYCGMAYFQYLYLRVGAGGEGEMSSSLVLDLSVKGCKVCMASLMSAVKVAVHGTKTNMSDWTQVN